MNKIFFFFCLKHLQLGRSAKAVAAAAPRLSGADCTLRFRHGRICSAVASTQFASGPAESRD